MSEHIEKQRVEILHKFIEKDIREKVLGVTIKPKPVNHYLGKTKKSSRKERLGHIHIVYTISNKALCNQKIEITDKVDLLHTQMDFCKACMKIYNNFNGDKIV